MKITIKSSVLVGPAAATPEHVIWNSNIDLVIPRIHTPSVYFYKSDEYRGLRKKEASPPNAAKDPTGSLEVGEDAEEVGNLGFNAQDRDACIGNSKENGHLYKKINGGQSTRANGNHRSGGNFDSDIHKENGNDHCSFLMNGDASKPGFFSFEHLKQALAKTLVPFYPMAGRLKSRDGVKGRVDIDCNSKGVLFVDASTDGVMSDFGRDFAPSMKMRQLIPRIDYTQDISTYPLLILQVTRFRCGGVALGVGVQHHVADGISALRFMNAWAAVAKGLELNVNLHMDRTILRARDPPQPVFEHVEYQPAPPLLKLKEEQTSENGHSARVQELVGKQQLDRKMQTTVNEHINRGELLDAQGKERHSGNGRVLKSSGAGNGHVEGTNGHAKAHNGHVKEWEENGCGGAMHSGESAGVDNGENVHVKIRANAGNGCVEDIKEEMRGGKELKKLKKDEELKEDVEGCGIVTELFVFTKEQLQTLKEKAGAEVRSDERPFSTYEALSAHVWQCTSIARGLQDAQLTKLYIATDGRARLQPPLPDTYFGNAIFTATPMDTAGHIRVASLAEVSRCIRAALHKMSDAYLRSALDFLELQPDLSALARGAQTFKSPNLGITSWVRLPIYAADFGWGNPLSMGPAGVPFEGLAYLLPGPPGDTSLRLSIALTPTHMKRFCELVYII